MEPTEGFCIHLKLVKELSGEFKLAYDSIDSFMDGNIYCNKCKCYVSIREIFRL